MELYCNLCDTSFVLNCVVLFTFRSHKKNATFDASNATTFDSTAQYMLMKQCTINELFFDCTIIDQ